jgi:ribose/xylose/arabinose/galactoside ABC-type transport system permease subunit
VAQLAVLPAARARLRLADTGQVAGVVLVWLLVVGVTDIYKPFFVSYPTFVAITFGMTVIGVMAIGQSVVMMSGGLVDLSAGVNAAGAAIIVAKLLQKNYPWEVAVVAALAFGLAYGAVNGSLVVFAGINPIITTLATQFAGTGILNLSSGFEPVPSGSVFSTFGRGRFLGTPNLFWVMLLLVLLAHFAYARTRPGRHARAIGGYWPAAVARGISRRRVRLAAFCIGGFFAAAGGVVLAAQQDFVETDLGSQFVFQVITAVLISGISMAGGRGRILALLASLTLISTLPTALVTLGFSSNWESVLQGLFLAIAVAIDALRRRI